MAGVLVSLIYIYKLDGVEPVDNIPSTDKFPQLYKNKSKCDTWHVTCNMWNMTCKMWQVACDMLWRVNILSKFQLPSFHGLWFIYFEDLEEKDHWLNESMTKVFVEQPSATLSLLNIRSVGMIWYNC